ncbi:protein NUCLEAR FUSION DEFECTIVE 6, chloroplastic/mitochondrial-like isoform X1 [Cynara cardunculus var. scolymus]|uniref:protein NUCLEAR FUSION DEFECTIVE 6, chloroplastic/mitochondrial-like isoform X1 n=1 Tax=Cynara cardunculus var. scolymus TaxID=59895 RepID=UPI000D626BD1|nr:protein NUCLEAR FUSION DEFECTIVE 6, chloroplastic/mitochondrial-like isoform X1 [Cynara cardunculus var. scolymus]
MTGAAAARSFLRSTSVRNAAARISSEAKCKGAPSPSPFRFSTTKPLSHRIFRCPVEMSVCLETMQPFHTATASALMTSMLTLSRQGYGWLSEGIDDTS